MLSQCYNFSHSRTQFIKYHPVSKTIKFDEYEPVSLNLPKLPRVRNDSGQRSMLRWIPLGERSFLPLLLLLLLEWPNRPHWATSNRTHPYDSNESQRMRQCHFSSLVKLWEICSPFLALPWNTLSKSKVRTWIFWVARSCHATAKKLTKSTPDFHLGQKLGSP